MQSEFEKYLKNSDHFRDALNTHRAATADVVAALMLFLVEHQHVSVPALRQFLKRLEDTTGDVSRDVSRRDLIARIADRLP